MAKERNGRHLTPNPRARSERRVDQATSHGLLRVFLAVILVAVSFVGGFALRSQTELVASWGIPVSDGEREALAAAAANNTFESVSARVGDVEDILSTYSMDEIDLTAATYSMLDDLMKSTGDPYATYYNPDLYNTYIKETTERSYAGIGVVFADYNGRAYVSDVFEGSEAEAKGVQQGDFLTSIDSEDVSAWSMTEVVNALAKDEGATVSVTWMRPASLDAQTGEQFTTTLTCKVYEEANLTTALSDGVGVVKVRQISSNAAELVDQATKSLIEQGAGAIVLDLRDNAGGYLTQAVDIASLFVNSGVLVQIQGNDGPATTKSAAGDAPYKDVPLVVVVNRRGARRVAAGQRAGRRGGGDEHGQGLGAGGARAGLRRGCALHRCLLPHAPGRAHRQRGYRAPGGGGKRRGGGWSGLPAGHRHRHRPLAHSGGLGSAAQRARAPSRLVREGR